MVAATSQSAGMANVATGSFTGAGAIVDVDLGFVPRYIKFVNVTDRTIFEYMEGMAATTTLKAVAAGTLTADTTSALVVTDNGFTISAAAAVSAKACTWVAMT